MISTRERGAEAVHDADDLGVGANEKKISIRRNSALDHDTVSTESDCCHWTHTTRSLD
jgi:hypothetical protein